MKYWNPETKNLQNCPYVKDETKQTVEVEQKGEPKKRTKKKEV